MRLVWRCGSMQRGGFMDAAKLAETAQWCEQQSKFLLADWEFQIAPGQQTPAGGPALPGIRDELVQRLTEIEPSLATVVENTYLFSRSDLAAVKLARWAELLRAMTPVAVEPAAVEEPAAATAERTVTAASVNTKVIDLLMRRPNRAPGRHGKSPRPWGAANRPWPKAMPSRNSLRPGKWPAWSGPRGARKRISGGAEGRRRRTHPSSFMPHLSSCPAGQPRPDTGHFSIIPDFFRAAFPGK